MKKYSKESLVSIVALVMTVLLLLLFITGCSKEKEKETDTDTATNAQTAAETQTEDDENTSFTSSVGDVTLSKIETYSVSDHTVTLELETQPPIKLKEIEPYKAKPHKIEFKSTNLDLDFSTEIYDAIQNADINANVNKETGEVTLDSSVLFDVDSYKISDAGKKSLDEFLDSYTKVVLDDEYKKSLDKIVVEGHTDTTGSYEYNLELSQKRADEVKSYCLKNHPELKDYLVAEGYSYEHPIVKSDDTIDMDASRRVVFKILTK